MGICCAIIDGKYVSTEEPNFSEAVLSFDEEMSMAANFKRLNNEKLPSSVYAWSLLSVCTLVPFSKVDLYINGLVFRFGGDLLRCLSNAPLGRTVMYGSLD